MHRSLCTASIGLSLLLTVSAAAAQGLPDPIEDVPFAKLRIPVRTTDDVFGYSPVTADKPTIQMLLRGGSYKQLDSYFDNLQRAADEKIGKEYEFVEALRAFSSPDKSLEEPLIAWKEALPRSAHAHVAMAIWYLDRAWEARGTNLAALTSPQAMELMTGHAKDAVQEAMAALQLDPHHLVAYAELIRTMQLVGSLQEKRQVMEHARRQFPQSYVIPRMYLNQLLPRWGGSHEAMNAFVDEVMADSALNPRLVTLRAAVLSDSIDDMTRLQDYAGALEAVNRALAYGPDPIYLADRAEIYMYREDNLRAIEDINQVLAMRHQDPKALHIHAALVASAAKFLRGNERAAALQQAKEELEANMPYDQEPENAREHLEYIAWQQTHCLADASLCKSNTAPLTSRITPGRWAILAVLSVILLYNLFRWVTGGFPVPMYIHVLSGIAGAIVLTAMVMMHRRQGGGVPWNYWLGVLAAPLLIYIVAIGLGGATWATQKRKRKEAALAAAAPAEPRKPVPFAQARR